MDCTLVHAIYNLLQGLNGTNKTRGVSHCGLAIYMKKDLRQMKNYGNSNISPCSAVVCPQKKKN